MIVFVVPFLILGTGLIFWGIYLVLRNKSIEFLGTRVRAEVLSCNLTQQFDSNGKLLREQYETVLRAEHDGREFTTTVHAPYTEGLRVPCRLFGKEDRLYPLPLLRQNSGLLPILLILSGFFIIFIMVGPFSDSLPQSLLSSRYLFPG